MRLRRNGIAGLVLFTAELCLLLALRFYSFHAFDRIVLTVGMTRYVAILNAGAVELAIHHNASMPIPRIHSYSEVDLGSGTFRMAHAWDNMGTGRLMRLLLSIHANDLDDFHFFPPHDWKFVAFGTEFISPLWPGWPGRAPSESISYIQLPIWPWIALSALFACRKWWLFLKSTRRQRAFPVELQLADKSEGINPTP